jgi:hypothetical protein
MKPPIPDEAGIRLAAGPAATFSISAPNYLKIYLRFHLLIERSGQEWKGIDRSSRYD